MRKLSTPCACFSKRAKIPTASIHLLRLGLPGSPIRFAPPAFVHLGVRNIPESCFRYWRSSRYQPILPVHREFHSPILSSSPIVLHALPKLSLRLSHATYPAAVAPFTPSNSGQHLRPTYNRDCWHVVCRRLLLEYRQNFFLQKRPLHPEGLPRSRGVAPSRFRALRTIPHCSPRRQPAEEGPCLSPLLAGRSLKPATRRWLGGPLPHRLPDRTQAHPKAGRFFVAPNIDFKLVGTNAPTARIYHSFIQSRHLVSFGLQKISFKVLITHYPRL